MVRQSESETVTKITVSEKTWQDLNARKRQPGETFDDVVQRLLSDIHRSVVTPEFRLERLPDERPPLSGVHPPECWLVVQPLHRGQPD